MPSENSLPPPTRWCGLGSADASDVDPGASAAEQALLHDDPKLVIVFCSESLDLEAALRAIRSRIDAPLIGCTTAGEIATTGPRDASIVVTVFGGDGFAVDTSFAEGASHDLRAAGAKAARCIPGSDAHPHRVLLLLTDGLAGDQQEILRGAYGVLGAGVPLVGGCAGRRPEDVQDAPAPRRPDPQRLRGGRRNRVERAARDRRSARMATGRRAYVGDRERGQSRLYA